MVCNAIEHTHIFARLVSDGSPSPELEILKFLNTEGARSNPHNHTIPILEFLEYDRYTFAIMPRYASCSPIECFLSDLPQQKCGQAFWQNFATVNQIMHMNKMMLEVCLCFCYFART